TRSPLLPLRPARRHLNRLPDGLAERGQLGDPHPEAAPLLREPPTTAPSPQPKLHEGLAEVVVQGDTQFAVASRNHAEQLAPVLGLRQRLTRAPVQQGAQPMSRPSQVTHSQLLPCRAGPRQPRPAGRPVSPRPRSGGAPRRSARRYAPPSPGACSWCRP